MYDFDEIIDRHGSHCAKWDDVGKELLPMWVADMDFKSAPEIIAALEERVRHGVFGYSGGCAVWDDSLIGWMNRRWGWEVKREWIFPSPGVVPALDMLVRALARPGEGVIIQTPVYPPFFRVVTRNGRRLRENPLQYDGRRYIMDLENLERQIDANTKLLILCSPHNPVGRVWSREELTALGEICLRHGITVIADEIHSDLVFSGYRHTVFASLGPEFEQICAVCNAPSKTFNLAGIQASNVIIPNRRIRSAYRDVLDTGELGLPNVFAVAALEAAYSRGEPWLEEMLAYVEGNYRFARGFIEQRIPEIKVVQAEGTYLLWLDCRGLGLSTLELDRFIREKARLVLSPGTIFGSSGSGFQRMNIGCPRALVEEGLQRLEAAAHDRDI
ncbi:MAG: MalY/PatB family protein [Syntrophomonadaceae bacterium]|nr:MalY/PatB family protein [Syntrophomonadaceae bacterium]